jgi:hypothetical protein
LRNAQAPQRSPEAIFQSPSESIGCAPFLDFRADVMMALLWRVRGNPVTDTVVHRKYEVVTVPVLELGPVSSSIARICGQTVARLTARGSGVVLSVADGAEAPRLGPADVANLSVAPYSATEKAEVAELRSLRSALYGDVAP